MRLQQSWKATLDGLVRTLATFVLSLAVCCCLLGWQNAAAKGIGPWEAHDAADNHAVFALFKTCGSRKALDVFVLQAWIEPARSYLKASLAGKQIRSIIPQFVFVLARMRDDAAHPPPVEQQKERTVSSNVEQTSADASDV